MREVVSYGRRGNTMDTISVDVKKPSGRRARVNSGRNFRVRGNCAYVNLEILCDRRTVEGKKVGDIGRGE
jgi:hypothetical protein